MASRQTLSPRPSNRQNARAVGTPRERSTGQDRPDDAEAPGSTRGRILAAAESLFAERGFDGASMPAIAKASGITAGAIYKHFDSKADLFFEVVRRAVQSIPPPAATASASGAELLTLEGHRSHVTAVAFSADGHLLASCGHDGVVRIWDGTPLGQSENP